MTLDRRTLILGIAAVGAVAAAATVTAVNHKSKGSPERRAVTAYVNDVNAIQHRMTAPLTRVMFAYRDFTAKGGSKKAAQRELAQAAATLRILQQRLVNAPAPPEAAKLRKLLIALVADQAALTQEVQKMAAFSPRFASVLRGARAANAKLSAALQAVSVPAPHKLRGTRKAVRAAQRKYAAAAGAAAAQQADAVDAFDASMRTVVARLRRLDPPAVFAPGYHAQVRALTHLQAAGARLSAELRKSDRKLVPALGRKFTLASREAQSVAAQRAQIEAVRAYNTRARAISAASGRVQVELSRLQRTLP